MTRAPSRRRGALARVGGLLLVPLVVLMGACGPAKDEAPGAGSSAPPPPSDPIPEPEISAMEPRVVAAIREARGRVVTDPASGANWGRYGIILDAHEVHDVAADCYRVARRLDPQEFRWHYFLARVTELTKGELDDVVAMYEGAAAIRPAYAPLWVRLGDVQVRHGDSEAARAAFEKAVELDPRLAKAHRGLGQTLLALKDPTAVGHLVRATELEPDDGAAWASLARAQTIAGDRTEARRAAARSRELDQIHISPDPVLLEIGNAGVSASVCFRRARELMDQGRYREAIGDLLIAAESLDSPHVHVRLGRCYQETGRLDEALASYEIALGLRDELADVHAQVGVLLVGRGRAPEAIPHYRRSLELDASNVKTMALLATALAQTGDPAVALRQYEAASRAGKLDAADHNNWGITLARVGRIDEAFVQFEEAVRLDPTFANARLNLGIALEQQERVDEAIEQYREAVRLDPRNRAAARLQELADR